MVTVRITETQAGKRGIQQHRRMRVELDGASLAIVSGMRRSIISDVPTLAMDTVTIHRNDSTASDDELAHRLGLLALHDPSPSPFGLAGEGEGFPTWTERTAEQAQSATASLTVEAVGVRRRVTAADIVFHPPCVVAVRPDAVLALLRPGEAVHWEASVAWGVGRWHSKWSPGVAVSAMRAVEEPLDGCGMCGDPNCGVRRCRPEGSVAEEESLRHLLEFSTTGSVSPPDALLRSLSAMRGKVRAFQRALSSAAGTAQ